MRILHVKKTDVAMAPDALAEMQRRYGFKSRVNDFEMDYDIVHFHNRYFRVEKPCVIQYHSEPGIRVDLNVRMPSLVISQYHATLLEYQMCRIVRNVIDIENPIYESSPVSGIRVAYSPSTTKKLSQWHDKGYNLMAEILEEIKRVRGDFSYDIITGVSLDECLARKARCNVVIDECITPSFHRSGLEGLAGGKLVICSLSNSVIDVLRAASGAQRVPFSNVNICNLKMFLKTLDNDYVIRVGEANKKWMHKYWHPLDIVKEYNSIYEEVCNAHRDNGRNRYKSQWQCGDSHRHNEDGFKMWGRFCKIPETDTGYMRAGTPEDEDEGYALGGDDLSGLQETDGIQSGKLSGINR